MARIVDNQLSEILSSLGAVYIRGPKWCGKSTTGIQKAKTVVNFQDAEKGQSYVDLVDTNVMGLLNQEAPILFDEWQIVPRIWNAVRTEVDKRNKVGQFILTGSTVYEFGKNMHSGAGRIARLNMKPMSLFESKDSNGKIPLNEVVKGNWQYDGTMSDLTKSDLAQVLCRGGWPSAVTLKHTNPQIIAKQYIRATLETDVSEIDNVKRNPLLAKYVLEAYSRNISTLQSDKSIYQDVQSKIDVSERTIIEYLKIFERLYLIDEIPAWSPNIRSKTAIRTSPKKNLVDPSIAAAILNVTPKELELDSKSFGLFFESLVARDVSVYTESANAGMSYYRDRSGLECDLVVHYPDGEFALIEVKLGEKGIEDGAAHLIQIRELLVRNNLRAPSALIVISGTQVALKRSDGVFVVPIGCLKP
ncbi:MAG: ATP-binding protein [Bacteroidia bacterium]|nr:ATP-binding protein [Bacteroidia bacterium]